MATEAKKKTNKREGQAQFKVWLPNDERLLFTQKAQEAGMTNTDWLRHRCIGTSPRRRRKGPDVMALHRLQAQINLLGGNVKQLAARANVSEKLPELERLEAMLVELQKMTRLNAIALGYDTQG